MLNDTTLLKLALKAFIIKEVSHAAKILIPFVSLYEIYFLRAHF